MSAIDLEYAISQYLDGTLPPIEAGALEERLATDPEARALFETYRALDGAIQAADPLPEIDFAAFHTKLSQALESEETPVRNYRIPAARWIAVAAIAACLLIAALAGIVSLLMQPSGGVIISNARPPALSKPIEIVRVDPILATPAPHSLASTIRISVGPPDASQPWRAADAVVDRPSHVIIAGVMPGVDRDRLPY